MQYIPYFSCAPPAILLTLQVHLPFQRNNFPSMTDRCWRLKERWKSDSILWRASQISAQLIGPSSSIGKRVAAAVNPNCFLLLADQLGWPAHRSHGLATRSPGAIARIAFICGPSIWIWFGIGIVVGVQVGGLWITVSARSSFYRRRYLWRSSVALLICIFIDSPVFRRFVGVFMPEEKGIIIWPESGWSMV